MNGPCMCGDPYCWSCGPAQGNSKCPYCGVWAMDGGCANPAAYKAAEAKDIEQQIEMDRQAEEWEAQNG